MRSRATRGCSSGTGDAVADKRRQRTRRWFAPHSPLQDPVRLDAGARHVYQMNGRWVQGLQVEHRVGANVESDMPRVSRTENGDAAVGDRDGVRSRQGNIASGSEEAARDNWHAALRSSTTNPATDLSAFDVEAVADFQRVDARLGRCRARRHHDRGTQGRSEYPVHTVDGHDTEVNTNLGSLQLRSLS